MRSFCARCSLVGCAVRACSVTVVIFIMNFGLVVDYSAHIAHHFMTHRGTPRDRAANALKEMGSSVFNGAFTTALGMLPLIWAPFQTGVCTARLSVCLFVFPARVGVSLYASSSARLCVR